MACSGASFRIVKPSSAVSVNVTNFIKFCLYNTCIIIFHSQVLDIIMVQFQRIMAKDIHDELQTMRSNFSIIGSYKFGIDLNEYHFFGLSFLCYKVGMARWPIYKD